METKICFEDIIAFIERAMKENLKIKTVKRKFPHILELGISIYDRNGEDSICIEYFSDKEKDDNYLRVTESYLDWVKVEVSEMDVARFKIEILKAKEYSKNKVVEYFNNFFIKETSEFTDINDLDDRDD